MKEIPDLQPNIFGFEETYKSKKITTETMQQVRSAMKITGYGN